MSSIDRRPHALRREKTLAIPRHIIFFDTETDQEVLEDGSIRQSLRMGWACYYRKAYGRHLEKLEWFEFHDCLSFWSFVFKHTERKRKIWVISLNIDFDFTIVNGWKYLRQVGFKLKFFHDSGTTAIISVKGRYGSIVFIDFMNWFSESVESLGKRIGLHKYKVDFEDVTDSELSIYCKRDVEILLAAYRDFVRFLEGNKISRLCMTIGSTAMAAYLFGSYDHKIYIHNNSEAIDLERDSYRGGRCECFYLGELNNGNYHVLDVNSLYATVMHSGSYPVKYVQIINKPEPSKITALLHDHSVIAKVLIDTDEPVYAVRRDRTIFPVGRFWVTLTSPELRYAFNHNHIVKIHKAVVYEQQPIFRKYVDKFYSLRMDFKSAGVDTYVEICKLMLNSLYGKFGQKAEVWNKVGECPNEPDRVEICFHPGPGGVRQIRYLLGEIWEMTGYDECFNSFPAIASQVTAYARMYMYLLMGVAGPGNYFYMDTDSLIVNEVGLCNLEKYLNPVNLGTLKTVEITPSIIIRGLKDYSTASKRVVKGIRKNAVSVSDGVYQQEVWPTLKGLLRQSSVDTYTVKQQTKVLQRKYTKGIVGVDGVIRPLTLSDSDSLSLWQP